MVPIQDISVSVKEKSISRETYIRGTEVALPPHLKAPLESSRSLARKGNSIAC